MPGLYYFWVILRGRLGKPEHMIFKFTGGRVDGLGVDMEMLTLVEGNGTLVFLVDI